MAPPTNALPFLALSAVLNSNYREQVAACAFKHYQYATADLQLKAVNVFNRRLRIDGFKHAARAPIERIRQHAIRRLPYDPQLSAAVIDLWIAANPQLETCCRRFCEEAAIAPKEVFTMEGNRIEDWSAEMREIICKGKDQYNQYDENDIALMLSCVLEESFIKTGKFDSVDIVDKTVTEYKNDQSAGAAGHEAEHVENSHHNLFYGGMWEQWLNTLTALPADAPEWLEVAEFIAAVQRLTEEKRGQREHRRAKLQEVLDALNASAAESLLYFEIASRFWMADSVALNKVETIASQISELHSALEGHAHLRTQKAATLLADRARLDEMSRLEEQISLLHQQLNSVFTSIEAAKGRVAPLVNDNTAVEEQLGLDSASDKKQCINVSAEISAANTIEDESPDSFPDELLSVSLDARAEEGEASEQTPLAEDEDHCADMTVVDDTIESPSIDFLERQADRSASALAPDGVASSWNDLLWMLLEKKDPAAAYWLSHSLHAAGYTCAASEQLLAALYAGSLLPFDSHWLAQDLAEIVRTYQCAQDDLALALLEIAAALRPALIAPNVGLQEWLHKTHLSSSLNKLTTALVEFAGSGNPLPYYTTERSYEVLPIEAAGHLAAEAARWLQDAPARRNINKAATDVWRKLTRAQGELWQLLDSVSRNQGQRKAQILEAVQQWEDRDWLTRRINELHADTVLGKKVQPINGTPLQQLMRDIKEGCQIARRWCAAIKREDNAHSDWLTAQKAKLRALANELLPIAETELREAVQSQQTNHSLTAAVHYLLYALQHLRILFQLPPTKTEESASCLYGAACDVDLPLESLLARRLWTLPELHLNDDGNPAMSDPIEIAIAIERAAKEERTLEMSIARLVQEQDFRFAKPLLELLPDRQQAAHLEQDLNTTLAAARARFSAESLGVLEEVEQGVVDGIISDVQRAEYSAEIEGLDGEDLLDIRSATNRLKEVGQKLSMAREQRLSYLNEKWLQMKATVAQRLGPDKFGQASAFVQAILERRDTRVIDECLAQIREALESGSELDESWFAAPQKRDPLKEFLLAAPEIEAWLQRHDGDLSALPKHFVGGSIGSWTIGELLRARRQEAGAAVKAWVALCEGKSRAQDASIRMAEVLHFLGFASLGAAPNVEVAIERRGAGWLHARTHASTGDLCRPIPQFGSLAADCHDLICFWDRPGANVIGTRLHEARLSGQSLLVFCFVPLSLNERIEIAKLARARVLNLAVLDDVLLAFLACENEAHLPSLLRCTLPFSAVDPYTPFKAGDVPPEMYFGREDMERALRTPHGSCLVYGGRQLGKSALLRQAQRQFHQPEQERFAVVEDIKMIGDAQSGQPTDAVWRRILEGFVRLGLMKRTTNKPDEIRRAVRDVMRQVPDRFVLMMLDEADNFLDADAADNFRVVNELRNLMTVTDRRFKVVFAGLQNVQRFHGIPNQPLAHFGRPISVGPLEPKAAQALVREPFEALGFRFADKAAVLRILSYTNYHAGLIQIFCQELLRRLRAKLEDTEPPYLIQRSDVEGVYRSRDVRDCIRERFDWTLALNPSYQAVAWTMIADQMRDHDSYARPYSAAEIKRLAEAWWPQGFSSVGGDQLRGLLDEMCGLGVLVRDASGYYRLRSPNLVRLIGTETDIESRLLELSERTPEVKYDADSHHGQLDETGASYSPLTYMQERLLNPPKFGVGLIFASQALGLAELEPAVKRFIPADLPPEVQSEFAVISPAVTRAQEMDAWLRDFVEARPRHERLIVFQRITGGAAGALAWVRECVRFCRSRRSQKQWLRVIFLFDDTAAWHWLLLPAEERNAIEEQVDASVAVRRLNLPGVRQRLSQSNKMYSDEVCQAVQRATGGWPWLLDHLHKNSRHDDPRSDAAALAQRLANPSDSLFLQWHTVVMPCSDHPALQVLRFISQEQAENGVPRELITPEFGAGASQEECDAAVEFLLRMGLLDAHDQSLCVEAVVQLMLKAGG
jgi:hypothetical protein